MNKSANLLINAQVIEAVNTGEDYPEVLEVEGEDAFTLAYHSTDAWRGYYEPVPIEGTGWEKVDLDEIKIDGWVTGDYDDAPSGARSSNVEDRVSAYADAQEAEGFQVVAVFTPTSNVFSTSIDVFRRAAR